MKRQGIVFALAFAVICLAGRASAWDGVGHMQVADIAWTKLNDKAKQEIKAILMAGDPRFRPVSQSDADVRDAFRKAATFPDEIKGNMSTIYESIIPDMNKMFFVTAPPDPTNNEDVRCKTWHYFDTPIRDSGHHSARESNALVALKNARAKLIELEGMPTQDRKMQYWWLAWVEHVTGDLHQPLHCASNYESTAGGDAGGNKFRIKVGTRPTALHGYWDGGIGRAVAADKDQGQSPNVEDVSKRWATDFAPSDADAANLDFVVWIKAGADLADSNVYNGITKNQPPSADYTAKQVDLCKHQAVLGGVRLAALLNDALGQ